MAAAGRLTPPRPGGLGLPRRAGRRTNVALLLLVLTALGTGVASYLLVPPTVRLVLLAHGAAGLGLLLLVPWKAVVVRRALRRAGGTGVALALAVLLALTTVSGVVSVAWGWGLPGPVTPLQVHVAAALAVVALLVLHVAQHPQRPRRTDLSRRVALRSALLGVGAVAAWGSVEGVVRVLGVPGAARRGTGSVAVGSGRPERMPVTQWFTDVVPRVEPAWRLRAPGRDWDRDELTAFDDHVTAVLDCTGGWYAEQDWSGVRLDRLLPASAAARSVEVVSVTGYRRRFPVSEAPRLLLATAAGGAPLSAGHGAPLRLVAPGHRGFVWVKWVERVELVDAPPWAQPPFPLQ